MKVIIEIIILSLLIAGFVVVACKKEPSVIPPYNKYPIAIAGADQVIYSPVDSAILDGSASLDRDGIIVSFNWNKVSGPDSFNIVSPTSARTVVTKLVKGIYRFQLSVTDNNTQLRADTLIIYKDTLPQTVTTSSENCGYS